MSADFCVCAIPAHSLWQINVGEMTPPFDKFSGSKQLQYALIRKIRPCLCSHLSWLNRRRAVFRCVPAWLRISVSIALRDRKGGKEFFAATQSAIRQIILLYFHCRVKNGIAEDVARPLTCDGVRARVILPAVAIEQQAWQKEPFTGGAYAFELAGSVVHRAGHLARPLACPRGPVYRRLPRLYGRSGSDRQSRCRRDIPIVTEILPAGDAGINRSTAFRGQTRVGVWFCYRRSGARCWIPHFAAHFSG